MTRFGKYSIDADRDNWVVMEWKTTGEKSKQPGKEHATPVAYFKHLKNCAEWIYTREAREKTHLLGVVAAFDAAKEEVINNVVDTLT